MEDKKPPIIENYLQCVVTELSSDEEINQLNTYSSEEEEEDCLEEQLQDTDTEQEISSADEDYNDVSTGSTVVGRDKVTKWILKNPIQNVKPYNERVSFHFPGVAGATTNSTTPLECWQIFFSDTVLQIIADSTNEYINLKKTNFARERDCRPTDLIEIKAFIAILYMAGFYRRSKLNLSDLWCNDSSGVEFFRLTLSEKRFYFLLRNISFDSKSTREERKRLDKLAPIRQIFDMFVASCRESFTLGEQATVDEKLIKTRGKCSFRQYIPRKSNKCGIKLYSLVDTKMLYTLNLEIYLGEQPEGPFKVDNSQIEVLKRLCAPIIGSERNITGDSWFTSYELVKDLKENLNLTYVGSINKSKLQIPTSFLTLRGREAYSTIFGNSEGITLMSYIPEKGKNLLLLSSKHSDPIIDSSAGPSKKPMMLSFYNNSKSSGDVVDKLCNTYSVSRSSSRWPMVVFYALLNLAAVNAHIIYKGSGLEKLRHFIKALAIELSKEHMKRRSEHANLPQNLKKRAAEVYGGLFGKPSTSDEKKIKIEDENEPQERKRKRCYICYRKKNRLTRYKCFKCVKFICLEHSKHMCVNCNLEM